MVKITILRKLKKSLIDETLIIGLHHLDDYGV